jgi:hypothetical protein
MVEGPAKFDDMGLGAMFKDTLLASAMGEVGFRRVGRYIYRADWSTIDVEHFVFFSPYGTPIDYLAADFGVRNQRAQTFALEEIRIYGGNVYQLMETNQETNCPMRFSLGRVASWGIRSSLKISSMSDRALAAKIKEDIEARLFPIVQQVAGIDRLLSFLMEDRESHSWVQCNGAIRAAMIIDLGVRQGISEAELQSMLEPYYRRIATNLLNAPDPDAASYIKKVIGDAISKGRRSVLN